MRLRKDHRAISEWAPGREPIGDRAGGTGGDALQNRNLAISSICRAPTLTPVIWPKWPGPIALSGIAKEGWFSRFVALALKSNTTRSVIRKFLWSDIFTAFSRGPINRFLPILPKV